MKVTVVVHVVIMQKNGELQVKLVALGEENTKLQDTIMAMANEKKELDLVHVESQHRAAQVGDD